MLISLNKIKFYILIYIYDKIPNLNFNVNLV